MAEFEFLGPYRIGKILGRGGMGNVYRGEHIKSGERVAVKVIASAVAEEPRFRRRFDKEIKTLKMLRHPGIVRLVGFGEQEGQLFYSMELVEGETLQAVIRQEKKLNWQTTIRYAIQICGALKHAHDIGVTHRDLKPANLILTADQQLKLVDFGIPKVFGDFSDQTAAGSVLGTPDYMAPEQANGGGITARTDLYALGSVMYAMLTGRAPFRGKNATEVIRSLTRDKPIPLDMLDVEMPPELGELIHELLEKEEKDRPRTALIVANRLKAMQAALASEQTLLSQSPSTLHGVGPSPTLSKDFPDRDTGEGKTGEDTAAGKAKPVSPSGKTVAKMGTVVTRGDLSAFAQDQNPAADVKTVVSGGGPTSHENEHADQASRVSRGGLTKGAVNEGPDQDESDAADLLRSKQLRSGTHFRTVDDSQRGTGIFQSGASEPKSKSQSLARVASLVAMIVILGIGVFLFLRAIEPPTADRLYEQAITGDRASAATFLRRFASDSRAAEVTRLQMNRRLNAILKRLTAKSKLGLQPMEPSEQTFLKCFENRETAPGETAGKLGTWLSVYEEDVEQMPDEEGRTRMGEMVELAKFMADDLASDSLPTQMDKRLKDLFVKIERAKKQEIPSESVIKLKAIIETFRDQPWAETAVEQAKEGLAERNK